VLDDYHAIQNPTIDHLSQPETLRHFMLGSSVWHPLSADTLDRLPDVSESQRHLQRLVEQNLFVSALSGEAETYAYHPLFREFLQTRLARQDPMWYAQLRLASARLYAEQARWERAVEALLALERYDEATETLARAEDSLRKLSEIATVASWLERIPVALSQMGPHLLALQGKLHLARGEPARAVPLFEQAIAAFKRAGDYAAAVDKAVWKGTALRFLGRYPECLAESERIQRWIACLPAEHPATTRLRAAGLHLDGVAQWHLGDLAHADTALNQARALFDTTDDRLSRANVYHDLGMVARARGEFPAALAAYRVALALWEQMGYRDSAAQTLNNLGYLHLLRGEMQEAERVLQDALQRARPGSGGRTEAAVLATLGDLSREQGEWTHALEFYRESLSMAEEVQDAHLVFYARVALGDTSRSMREWTCAREWLDAAARCVDTAALVERGQLALAEGALASDQGQLDAAGTWLHRAADDFRRAGDKHLEALAEYRLASLTYARGHTAQAQVHLRRTAELIEMLGYDHFLVVEGRHTLAMLHLASTLPGVGQRFKRILERVHPVPPPAGASRRVTATAPKVSVYTLGQEQFIVRGKAVTRLRPQVREVFWYLLVRAPTEVRKEELAELFWPHLSAERASGVLRITLTRLRQALGVVVTTNGGYTLDTASLWYDVREFEQGLRAARQTPGVQARITRLKQTLELYRGDYLERLEAYWALAERARLRQMYLDALMRLAESYGEMAEWEAARETFQRAARVEPFLEAAWAGTMKMDLRLGNRMAALAQYAELEQLLRDEMGLDPSPELQALYHDIKALRV
jgi:LuxR family maltose regulon positive regulatory protein